MCDIEETSHQAGSGGLSSCSSGAQGRHTRLPGGGAVDMLSTDIFDAQDQETVETKPSGGRRIPQNKKWQW